MRTKLLLLCLSLTAFISPQVSAQYEYVLKTPQNRVVVLEEFTGVNCGWCPQGHTIAKNIERAYPNAVVINIHAGAFANPGVGQPDFRTAYGTTINNGFGANAYPSGMLNRHNFGSGIVTGRGTWAGNADRIADMNSPVNIGMVSNYDPLERELSVDVEYYYTADAPEEENFLHLVLLENGVIGYQANYDIPAGSVQNYTHNNILRSKIHRYNYGDTIRNTKESSTSLVRYTYKVPANIKPENCDVAAFISSSRDNIYSGAKVKAVGGSTLQIGGFEDVSALYNRTPKDDYYLGTYKAESLLDKGEEFEISLTNLNSPISWKANLIIDGETYGKSAVITMDSTTEINLAVVPSGQHGIGSYQLEIKSLTFPEALSSLKEIYVMTDVTDLILVTGESVPNNVDLVAPYKNGLTLANNDDVAVADALLAAKFIESGNIDGLKNLYYSVGWTFPAIKEPTAVALAKFLDQGGNLLIAGQDIGWDVHDANGNGTNIIRSFWRNYIKTRYLNDGSASTNSMKFIESDKIFGHYGAVDIVSVYGSGSSGPNVYPEEVLPSSSETHAIIQYPNNRVGGVRVETDNYKLVYLGVGLEMLANDQNTAEEIVRTSHDWFNGLISSTEFERSIESLGLGKAYPNPASDFVTIPINDQFDSDLQIVVKDLYGRSVLVGAINSKTGNYTLDISNLINGTYFYSLSNGVDYGPARKLIVQRN
jgi:hypothetical protein